MKSVLHRQRNLAANPKSDESGIVHSETVASPSHQDKCKNEAAYQYERIPVRQENYICSFQLIPPLAQDPKSWEPISSEGDSACNPVQRVTIGHGYCRKAKSNNDKLEQQHCAQTSSKREALLNRISFTHAAQRTDQL